MRTRLGLFALVILLAGGVITSAQTARTGGVMRQKLGHTQKLLEALTTSNQALLARESEALSGIAASPAWNELRTPELRGYTDRFLKAVADLDAAAKRRDLDTAATSYNTLITTCYQCHRHMKDSRIAKAKGQ
jgi:cytochrome c556